MDEAEKRRTFNRKWLRLDTEIGSRFELCGLSAEAKLIFILILCEASKVSSTTIQINFEHLSIMANISCDDVGEVLNALEERELLETAESEIEGFSFVTLSFFGNDAATSMANVSVCYG